MYLYTFNHLLIELMMTCASYYRAHPFSEWNHQMCRNVCGHFEINSFEHRNCHIINFQNWTFYAESKSMWLFGSAIQTLRYPKGYFPCLTHTHTHSHAGLIYSACFYYTVLCVTLFSQSRCEWVWFFSLISFMAWATEDAMSDMFFFPSTSEFQIYYGDF